MKVSELRALLKELDGDAIVVMQEVLGDMHRLSQVQPTLVSEDLHHCKIRVWYGAGTDPVKAVILK